MQHPAKKSFIISRKYPIGQHGYMVYFFDKMSGAVTCATAPIILLCTYITYQHHFPAGAMRVKKCHMAMPPDTETLSECFVPSCGISRHTSH